jgi:phosphoribosylaminoimidazole carboxylase (NCAIR synthetase)
METLVKKKHNYKLSPEDKRQILVEYTLNRKKENVRSLCSRFDISETTLYDIVKSKQGQEILEQHIIESKKNFSKKLDMILEKTIDKLGEKIDDEDIKALDYAKIGGILYDKSRLEHNLSTSNNSININIKVEK